MKKVLLFALIICTFGCKDNLDYRLVDEDSHEIRDRICEDLEDLKCIELKEIYKIIVGFENSDDKDKAILEFYGMRYNDLTFRDVLNRIEVDNNKSINE
ncbi:hypothetical protein [Psychroserpens luteus]|uniref:DUF4476 domain-containing protein n=1 Tax=Psychroserpens luteus TaxID=1434066 RepID=A0ABW5ZSY3_9FLAO|nr:hypothetical protein [Psychroserpens luteus]